jgi:hypothetical protein
MRFDLWQTERERAEVLPCGIRVLRKGTPERPTATLWMPKGIRPFANYLFRSEARREEYIAQQVESYLDKQRRVAERKAARAGRLEGVKLETVEVGDIFNWSWGYDQTNQDFYQVVEKRGRQVVVKEVAQAMVPGSQGFMSESVLAVKDSFLDKTYQSGRGDVKSMTKLVQWTSDGKAFLAMPYGWCDKWDGKAQYASHYA